MVYFGGPMTNQEIARGLSLSIPTVSQMIKELMEAGIIEETARQKSSGGRRATIVAINPNMKYSIGIGISKNHIRLILLNLAAEVVEEKSIREPFAHSGQYWDKVREQAESLRAANQIGDGAFLGYGMSLPGVFFQKDGGTMVFAPTLCEEELNMDDLPAPLMEHTIVMNDAQLAGLSHMWKKPPGGTEKTIYLLLNKGVGGAILPNGNSNEFGSKAAEFGHMVIRPDGKVCSCGRKGCLEAYCSSGELYDAGAETIDAFFDSLKAKDGGSVRIWNQYLKNLAIAIHNLRMVFDCNIVVGGEVSCFLPDYEEKLRAEVDRHNPFHEHSSFLSIGDYGFWDSSMGAAISQIDYFLNHFND